MTIQIHSKLLLLSFRYRAIMYPLRRKPTKLFSKIVILCIWILAFAFALPMGIVHTFGMVDDIPGHQKPFCYIDFGPNATQSITMFKYYRYVLGIYFSDSKLNRFLILSNFFWQKSYIASCLLQKNIWLPWKEVLRNSFCNKCR